MDGIKSLALIAFLGISNLAQGAISFVSANAQSFASAGTYALTFTSSADSTSILILGGAMGGTSVVSTAAWGGASFTRLSQVAGDNVTVFGTEAWYIINPSPSTTSNVTITVSGANVASSFVVAQYTGISQSSPLPTYTWSKRGDSGTTLSTTLTTTVSNSWVISVLSALAGGATSGSSFTTRQSSSGVLFGLIADKSTTSPGNVGSYWSGTGGYPAQFLIELAPFVAASANTVRTMELDGQIEMEMD